MATREELLAEATRRGLVQPSISAPGPATPGAVPQDRAALEAEAARRGLIAEKPALAQPGPDATQEPLVTATGATPATFQARSAPIGELLSEAFTGRRRKAELPEEVREAPELVEVAFTKDFDELVPVGQQLKLVSGLLAAVDPQSQVEIIKKQIPDAEIDTVQGVTTVKIGGQLFTLNRPGLSAQDRTQALAQFVAFLPQAKLTSLGKGLLTRTLTSATTAAGTSAGLDIAAQQLGAEEGVSVPRAATAGALGLVSEVAPAVTARVREGRQAARLGVEREALGEAAPAIAAGEEAAEAAGIRLFPAQKTLDPFALEEQSFIASHPAAARKASEQLKAQNAEAHEATVRFLNELAPEEAVARAAPGTRKAAQLLKEAIETRRREAASPIYNEAFATGGRVNLKPVIETIRARMQAFPDGKIRATLGRALKLIKDTERKTGKDVVLFDAAGKELRRVAPTVADSNLHFGHAAKLEIDDLIQTQGGKSLGKTAERELLAVKDALKQELDSASKEYTKASATFAELSPALEQFEESILGRISKLKDVNLDSVRTNAFKNVATMRQVRNTVNAADPSGATWRALVREEAEERLKKIDVLGLTGAEKVALTPDNAPAKLSRALFGSGQKRRVLLDSLPSDEMRKNAVMLEEAMSRAALGRPGGSQTGIRAVITSRIEGAGIAIRRWLKNPIERTLATGDAAAFNKSVRTLGDALFDPKWQPELSKIRTFKGEPKEVTRAMTQLLTRVNKSLETEEE